MQENELIEKPGFQLFYLKNLAFRLSYKNSSNYLFNLLFDKHFRPDIYTHILDSKSTLSNSDYSQKIKERNLEYVSTNKLTKLLKNEDLNDTSRNELEFVKFHLQLLHNQIYLSISASILCIINVIGTKAFSSPKKKKMYGYTMGVIVFFLFPFNIYNYISAYKDYHSKPKLDKIHKNSILKYKYFFEN